LYILHSGSDASADADWAAFPGVREVLTAWDLLEPGSPRTVVARDLGVEVAKIEARHRSAVNSVVDFLSGHTSEMLVLATHGREGLSRWLHGSIAEQIAAHARIKTLFLPEGAHGFVDPDDGRVRLHRVLVPVDHAPPPEPAIDAAKDLARLLGADPSYQLLHVGAPADMPSPTGLPEKAECIARPGEPVEQILAGARYWGPNLIVMTTVGHEGFLDALRGSTSEQVVRRAPCPVLVVPTP
jgi:nucleotide-binding universal stress UspA family protein